MKNKKLLMISIFLITLLFVGVSSGFFNKIISSIKEQKFKNAARMAERYKGKDKDFILLLKGNAYAEQGNYNKALISYNQLLSQFPKSKWLSKAIFRKADTFVKLKKFNKACNIYESQLKKLVKPDRRNQLAMVYKKLADSIAFPKKLNNKKNRPNYSKAIVYYDKALAMGKFDDVLESRIKLSKGICYYKRGSYYYQRKAADIFKALLKDFSKKVPKILPDLYYYLASTYAGLNRRWEAKTYYYMLIRYKKGNSYSVKGAFDLLKLYNFPYVRNKRDLALGKAVVDIMIGKFKNNDLTVKALFFLGKAFAYKNNIKDSIDSFNRLVELYPNTLYAAESAYNVGVYLINSGQLIKAKKRFQEFLTLFPSSKFWQKAQQKIINIEYDNGLTLFKKKKYNNCIKVWKSFLNRYPLDSRNPEILSRIGTCYYRLKNYHKAIAVWDNLSKKYSGRKQAALAKLNIAETYSEKLYKFERAISYYTNIKHWQFRRTARERLNRLKKESLLLSTRKVFFSEEKASVDVQVRNVSNFYVKIYYFDLNTYFRKIHSISSIEKLDIDLINPDKQYKYHVKDYQKYKLSKFSLPINEKKQGAYLISCRTDKLKSTTMLIVSDLGLQFKFSPKQLFVFTMNLKTRKVLGNVNLLFSNGKEIFLKAKTSSKGIYVKNFTKFRQASNISVFAYKGRMIASSKPGRVGSFSGKKIQFMSYLKTDRPVYRPGDKVFFKYFVRKRFNGIYSIPKQKFLLNYTLPSGLVNYSREVYPNSYGTISGNFKLDKAVSQGHGTFSLISDNRLFSAYDKVAIKDYKPKKTVVLFNTDKNVYLPGEKIRLNIKVSHLFGIPARNKKVLYKINNDAWRYVVTDKRGLINKRIDSLKYAEGESIIIRIKPAWETREYRHKIPFLQREYGIVLKTVRSEFLLNEKISIKVKLLTKYKIEKNKRLNVKLVNFHEGREVKIDEDFIKTDNRGKGVYKFNAENYGKYILYVYAKSQTGEVISAVKKIKIIKKNDARKIFILNNKDSFYQNERFKIKLYSKLKRNVTALVTMERDNVIHYRIINLKKGFSFINFPISEGLFPNFHLKLSVSTRTGFYQVDRKFKIKRKLRIKLLMPSKKKVYRPGQNISMKIVTQDNKNSPKGSELFVAVVDDSVYSALTYNTSSIEAAFYKPYYYSMMKIDSFTPFKYKGMTRMRDKDLIAEEKRVDKEKKRYSSRKFGRRLRLPSTAKKYKRDRGLNEDDRLRDESEKHRLKNGKTKKAIKKIYSDIAFFKTSLKTDRQGRAVVKFKLPSNITKWRIVVLGVTKKSFFGMKEKTFTARKDVFFKLDCPEVLQEGDKTTIKARLFNLSSTTLSGMLSYSVIKGDKEVKKVKTYTIKSDNEFVFPINIHAGKNKKIKIKLYSEYDTYEKEIEIKPKETVLVTGRSGISRGIVRIFPKLNSRYPTIEKKMIIRIASPISTIVGDLSSSDLLFSSHISGRAGRLLRMISYYKYLKSLSSNNRGKINQLYLDVMNMQMHFRILQKNNNKQLKDVENLAYTFFAVSAAKNAGIKLPGYLYSLAAKRLHLEFSSAKSRELKALILFALSWGKSANYAYLNRFYRFRATLSSREQALIIIALKNMDRQAMASVMSDMLVKNFNVTSKYAYLSGGVFNKVDWFSARVDLTALGILALQMTKPNSPIIKKGINWLIQKRKSHGWYTTIQNGLCPFVIGRYFTSIRFKEDNYRVNITVNGKKVGFADSNSPKTFVINETVIKENNNRVVLNMNGRGKFFYSVQLIQKVKGFIDNKNDYPGTFKVKYNFPNYRIGDKVFKKGYSIVKGSYKKVKNKLFKTSLGIPLTVETTLYTGRVKNRYFILTHTLPSGMKMLPGSIYCSSGYYYEKKGNKLIFWIRKKFYSWITLKFKIIPELTGHFNVPPVSLYLINNPENVYSTKATELIVLKEGADIWKDYKMSPNELFRVGEYLYKQKKYTKAQQLLKQCIKKYKIYDSYYKEIAKYLLFINVYLKRWKSIVKYFEILKERYPDLTIPFKEASVVSKAYYRMGEFERAYQILEGIMEGYFYQESTISGALQVENSIKKSIIYMEKLFSEYPDKNVQSATYYSLGQQLADRAEQSNDKQLKKLGVDKKFLYTKALKIFENFLLFFPTSSVAPETAFSIVSLYTEQEKYKTAMFKAFKYMRIYNKSSFLDSFHYIAAYSLFFQKKFSSAIKYCRNVAFKKYKNKNGEMAVSKNKDYAIHMLGKIYHSLQYFNKALKQYNKVSKKFVDASRAVKFLYNKEVSVPEVSLFGTGERAKLKIRYKGVQRVSLTIYKVDFLTLCLKEKDLSKITKINLAGIKPHYKKIITLSRKLNYLSRIKEVNIPVYKKGAYLIVLKSNSIESSGMVIKSDLVLDVLEIVTGGSVRVNVRNKKTGQLERGVVMKFIGSNDSSFKTALTDLRGMAEISGLNGLSTVVGVKDGHYCFYRGTTQLRKSHYENRYKIPKMKYKKKALERLNKYRRAIQRKNRRLWDYNIQQEKKGLNLKYLK